MKPCKYRIPGNKTRLDCVNCGGSLEHCTIPYIQEVRRYVAEQFAGDVENSLQTFLPLEEERKACRSELEKAFRKCIDSDCRNYRIIDFQVEITDALERAIPDNQELYNLTGALDCTVANWIPVFQRFKRPRKPGFLHID